MELATSLVSESPDRQRQLRLVDRYIEDLHLHLSAGAMISRPEVGDRTTGSHRPDEAL